MILWYKRCSLAYRVSVVLFFVYEKEDEGSKCVVEALAAYGFKDTFVPTVSYVSTSSYMEKQDNPLKEQLHR